MFEKISSGKVKINIFKKYKLRSSCSGTSGFGE